MGKIAKWRNFSEDEIRKIVAESFSIREVAKKLGYSPDGGGTAQSLKKMFNRGFTKGFMLGCKNDGFTNEVRPNHVGVKIGEVKDFKNGFLSIRLTGKLNVHDALRILDDKEDKGIRE